MSTLLGRPVHQLAKANIHNKGIKACIHGQEVQLVFKPNVRTGKKCDLSDFDSGMIVGARQGGLSISEATNLGVFMHNGL